MRMRGAMLPMGGKLCGPSIPATRASAAFLRKQCFNKRCVQSQHTCFISVAVLIPEAPL